MRDRYDLLCTITGVSGFVGSHLARALLGEGSMRVGVFGVDLEPSSRIEDLMSKEDFHFDSYDVHQPVRSDYLAVDAVYHFAGIADPARYLSEPITVMDLNLKGLTNILERISLWKNHRPRIIYSSTSEVYGKSTNVPFLEDETDLVFGPTKASRWCYAMSKAVGEHYLMAYSKREDIRHTIFRFFNFVGEDVDSPGKGRVITKMVADGLDGGEIRVTAPGDQTRCFTYHEDFVQPLVMASLLKRFRGSASATVKDAACRYWDNDWVINLGSDEETKMVDLAYMVAHALKKLGHTTEEPKVRIVPGTEMYGEGYEDAERRKPDVTKAKEILGWTAGRRLHEFLPSIVDAVAKEHLRARGGSGGGDGGRGPAGRGEDAEAQADEQGGREPLAG